MQCTSYDLGCYYLRDLNVGLNGCSWPPANSTIIWNGGQSFNVLMPPPPSDHDLGPQKEICRQMMLKHESTFKYQVYELHRLYRRQKELMEEARNRELLEHSLKLRFVSETMSGISMETHWPSRNPTGIESSLFSTPLFQEPSRFITGDNEQLATDRHTTKDDFEGFQHSSSQRNKSRKRMLDLELPGDLYIDIEEEDDDMKLQPVNESKLVSSYPESSSVSESSCRKNILFDLNEPAQTDESDFPSSSCLLESDSTQHEEIMYQNHELSEKEKSNADCSLPDEETLPDITVREEESHSDAPKTSPLLEEDKELDMLPFHSRAGEDTSNSNSSDETSCCPVPRNPLKKRRKTLDSKMSEKNRDEANIDASSYRRKSIHDSKEFPVVVQALPCINDTSLKKCFKSSISNLRLRGTKCSLNKTTSKRVKVSDRANIPEVVDLNLDPPRYLSDDDFSGPNTIPRLNPPEHEDNKETGSSGKYRAVDSSLNLVPRKQQKYDRDLKAPVSPENRECPPPREDSQEEGGEQENTNDRLAADTLILILSSRVEKYSNITIGCLDWFAGIASALGNDQGDDIPMLRKGKNDKNRILSVAKKKVKPRTRKMKVVEEVTRQKKMKLKLETEDQTCYGRRKARRSLRAVKNIGCSHLKQQSDGNKLSSDEWCLKVWGNKKKRMAPRARSGHFSAQIFGISS